MSGIIFNENNEVINIENKSKDNLKRIATENQLSEKFILENADLLDWAVICENQALTTEIMVQCIKKIKWKKALINSRLSGDTRLIARYKADFTELFRNETLTSTFLQTHKKFFDWQKVIPVRNQHTFCDELVEELKGVLDINHILSTQKNNLSEAYFNDYKHFKIEDFYKTVTEEWILQQPTNYVNWFKISEFTPLSDDFILTHWDKLNLIRLITKREFSEDLMRGIISKNISKPHLKCIFECQNFSKTFLDEFKHLIS